MSDPRLLSDDIFEAALHADGVLADTARRVLRLDRAARIEQYEALKKIAEELAMNCWRYEPDDYECRGEPSCIYCSSGERAGHTPECPVTILEALHLKPESYNEFQVRLHDKEKKP